MKSPTKIITHCFITLAAIAVAASGAHAAERAKSATVTELPAYFNGGQLRIVSSSHQDTAWMDTPDFCREFRIEHNIMPALERMRVDPDYTFCMEGMLHLMEFVEAHPELRDEIAQRTREGRLEWGATYNQPYESWLSGEELIRQTYYGRRWLKKNFPGCDAKVAFNPDPPARSWQMQQILAKAGIPYLFISRYHEGLYRWRSPDGSSVLAYTPGHYANHLPMLNGAPEECMDAVRGNLAQHAAYYEKRDLPPVYAMINSMDFSKPVDFKTLINSWNAQPVSAGGVKPPVMQYSSIRGFFEAIDRPEARFDSLLGERPDVWMYITGPTHHVMSSLKREAARLLPAAETFTTMASLLEGGFHDWPTQKFARAWMDELYPDHGLGGKNGHITDEVFRQKVANARDTGSQFLTQALNSIAARVKAVPGRGMPVTIFNTLSWVRSDVVEFDLPADLADAASVRVMDADGREVSAQPTTLGVPDEINVAAATMGATAVASSIADGEHGAEKAIDGSWAVRDTNPESGIADGWRSARSNGPHWLTIDLGRLRTVHKIVLRHEGVLGIFGEETKNNTTDFQLLGAETAAGPWTDLVSPVVFNQSSLSTHSFAPKKLRYIRVLITKSAREGGDEPARLCEVQAFEKATESARKLVFVAADVPALGYKTYYLTAGGSRESASVPEVSMNPDGFENRFYRVQLAPGGIKSIFDKAQGRELLNTSKFLGGEVFTMLSVAPDNRRRGTDAGEFGRMPLPVMDDSFDRVANHKPQWNLLENGPVRAVYQLEQPLADTTVRQRLVVWHSLGRLDCEVDLAGFNGRLWREYRMALPLAAEKPRLVYEVPMGVIEIGRDEIPTTGGEAYIGHEGGRDLEYPEQCRDIHPRQVQNFVDASDEKGGLTMSSSVAVFDWIDPTTNPAPYPVLQPVLLASRKSCNRQGVWYPQAGDHTYRFSLTSHEGDWRNGRKAGIAANHSLFPVLAKSSADGTLSPVMSFCTIDSDNLIVSTIKKCEDDDSVIVRLYDIEGKDRQATVTLFRPAMAAAKTDLLEENGQPLPIENGRVRLDVGHHAIETIKLTLGTP